MRTRQEIEEQAADMYARVVPRDKGVSRLILELLLDIRELLSGRPL